MRTLRISTFLSLLLLVSFSLFSQDLRYIDASTLNLREKPSSEAEVLSQLPRNLKVILIREVDDEWSEIRANLLTGYVASKYLSKTPSVQKTESKVYICNSNSAYAYHSYKCHGFNRCRSGTSYVVISEAKRLGYRACKICY